MLGIFNTIQGTWLSEGSDFYSYVQANLVGMGSDGAAVNLGQHGGIQKLLSDWMMKNIFAIHCLPHRLYLATTASISGIPYFSKFEDILNEIYHFYNPHGHKRKSHLRELASVLNVHVYQYSYV